jgi:hypothetical protein
MFTAQQHADLESLLAAWRGHSDVLSQEILHAEVAEIAGPASKSAWTWFEGMIEGLSPVTDRFVSCS